MKRLAVFIYTFCLLQIYVVAQNIITVAAYDSSEEAKSKADYVCDGVHDELTIQSILDNFEANPRHGCVLQFNDGTYNIDGFHERNDFLQPTAICIGQIPSLEFKGISTCMVGRGTAGPIFNVQSSAYEGISPDVQTCLIACSINNPLNSNHVTLKNFQVILPDMKHKVICINTFNTGGAFLENIKLSCKGFGPGKMPVEGLVAIRGTNTNSNGWGQHWRDIGAFGFYEGFQVGGEHLVAVECLARNCYYGFTFGNYDFSSYAKQYNRYGVWEHPLTLINCAEELCAALPLFAYCGGSRKPNSRGYQVVDLISHCIEIREKENPTLSPIIPAKEIMPGTWCGNITFAGNKFGESMENAVDVEFWDKDSGKRFFTRNSAHSLSGTTRERKEYTPMYMQQYFDTDLNKLLIYDGEKWIDTDGNDISQEERRFIVPEFDVSLLPAPVFEKEKGFVDLYWLAWKQAYEHIKYQEGLPQPLYMDEGLWDDTIWIWDSEFMTMFCKYAPNLFPGIQTLDNFYYTMLEDSGSSLRIQHPDNPPFFAWVEAEYFKFTNDTTHLNNLICRKKFLQRYFHRFNSLTPDTKLNFTHYPMALKFKGIGYNWNGISSGMDNTPRYDGGNMLWVDAISQQALSALYISRLAKIVNDKNTCKEFKGIYNKLKRTVNKYYWDKQDKCYYDIYETDFSFSRILTPASFWPVLAEIPSRRQVKSMIDFALTETRLGGTPPWVTISRDHPDFNVIDGEYWKGAIWLPTAYMAIKAIEKYGFFDEANETSEKILSHMLKTYIEYSPHTIWECYSPVAPAPSSNHGKRVREDFCGWSALGPISLFIENVLGFYEIDASNHIVKWNLHHTCRHGIERLKFGDVLTDIIYSDKIISVKSNSYYTLIINGKANHIRPGINTITL